MSLIPLPYNIGQGATVESKVNHKSVHLCVFELQGQLEKGGCTLAHVSREVSGAIELAVRKSPDSVEKVARLTLAEQRADLVGVATG